MNISLDIFDGGYVQIHSDQLFVFLGMVELRLFYAFLAFGVRERYCLALAG